MKSQLQKNFGYKFSVWMIILISCISDLYAQVLTPARYEIDAKRGSLRFNSPDALPRGREFKRIDSTYYVGWMFEGLYKYEHAADYIGFRMAAEQLEKASLLLEKDFKKELKNRTQDVFEYIQVMNIHKDWDYIAYSLMQCYSNMEAPDKVWELLQRCKKMNLQDEYLMETYNFLAWTVHRNRFYTKSKYSFLKNTITENEEYANKLLDSSVLKNNQDAKFNSSFINQDYYTTQKAPAVWHYKSILYAYQLNIKLGSQYYEKLRKTAYFPENNFATFCLIQGKFKDADYYYSLSKKTDQGDKRMKESFYYSSVINAYKNNNKQEIEELKNLIKANGSTPGFGWYNLALTRSFIYDGQNQIASRYLTKATQFKEIHIGTTLGQTHYDFTSSLLNFIIKGREIEQLKFQDRNWWYHVNTLSKITKLIVEKFTIQYLIINQFSNNPERDLVIYKLFSTESTVSFDEIWYLINGFSTNFFIEKFKRELNEDSRPLVKRYFKLFLAKLYLKKENFKDAKKYLNEILNEKNIDIEYEKLFLARTYETMIHCNEKLKIKEPKYYQLLMLTYPQLIPYTDIPFPIQLESNANTDEEKELINSLKKSNIHWVENAKEPAAVLNIRFSKRGNINYINYKLNWGGVITPESEVPYKNIQSIQYEIPYLIFGIGNDDRNWNLNQESKKK
ncbi:MAG TPA: hypothetical protein PKA54_04540 [Chitinophagaceae bacterium]|nr:hypothetical protein [Chitinophagaceae bacterium]